jgi:hypothetical protein
MHHVGLRVPPQIDFGFQEHANHRDKLGSASSAHLTEFNLSVIFSLRMSGIATKVRKVNSSEQLALSQCLSRPFAVLCVDLRIRRHSVWASDSRTPTSLRLSPP